MTELVAIAKAIASQRDSDFHPVANLQLRAVEHISGHEFVDAMEAAIAEGFLIVTPNCGPKQLGVFKLTGK